MTCKEFLNDIVTTLTGETPIIKINEDEFGAVIVMDVRGRLPLLIGKNGTNIDAVRTLAKAIGYNGLHRIKLQINES